MTDNAKPTIEDAALWQACFEAVARPPVHDAIDTLYVDLSAAIAKRGPTCWVSGRCCNFNAYGHRLYVTALEIAWLLPQVSLPGAGPGASEIDLNGPCVFQREKLCGVHTLRPLGCRAFFCQEGTQQWQHDLYEDFQSRLRELHDTHAIPYRYLEWRAGLAEAMGQRREARSERREAD